MSCLITQSSGTQSVRPAARVHSKRLLTQLKLTNTPVGLLINLAAATLREVYIALSNGFPFPKSPRPRVNHGAERQRFATRLLPRTSQ